MSTTASTTVRLPWAVTEKEPAILNEGIIRPDVRQLMKTEMIREFHETGGTTPLHWQEGVFKRCTSEDLPLNGQKEREER